MVDVGGVRTEVLEFVIQARNAATGALSEAGAELEGFSATAHAVGQGMVVAGAGLTAVGVGAAAGIGALVEAGQKWQSTLTTIQNNTGLTTAQTQQMGQEVMTVASQTGSGLTDTAMGWMHIQNIVGNTAASYQVLQVAAESAVSTNSSVSDVATVLANVMHEYGLDVSHAATAQERATQVNQNAAYVMGVLHQAVMLGNTTLDQFTQYAGRAIGIGANLGVPIEQVAAATIDLTKHGFDMAQAGTQVTNILTHMINPTKAAETEIQRLSKATGINLVSDFTAAGVHTKGLTGVITDLEAAYRKMGLTQAQAEGETMKLINAQRGGLGMATLLGTGYNDYGTILQKVSNRQEDAAVSQQALDNTLHTLSGQVNLLKANLEVTAITLGQALMPNIEQLLGQITPLVERFRSWATANATVIANLLELVAKIGLVGGPLLTLMGFLTMSLGTISRFGSALGGLFRVFTAGPEAIGAIAAAFGPVGVIILAVAAAAAALYIAFNGGLPNLSKLASSAMTIVRQAFAGATEAFNLFRLGFVTGIARDGNVWTTLGSIVRSALTVIQGAINAVMVAFDYFKLGFFTGVSDGANRWVTLGGVIHQIVNGIGSALSALGSLVHGFFAGFQSGPAQSITSIQSFGGTVRAALNAVGQTVQQLVERWGPAWQNISAVLGRVAGQLGAFMSQVGTTIRQLMDTAEAAAAEWNGVWTGIETVLQGIFNIIEGLFRIFFAEVTGIVKIALDLIGGNWKQAGEDWSDMVGGIWAGIEQIFQGAGQIIIGAVQALLNGALISIHGFAPQFADAASDLINGLVSGIEADAGKVAAALGNAVMGALNGAKHLLGISSPSTVMARVGQDTMTGLANGITSGGTTTKAALAAQLEQLRQQTAQQGQSIRNALTDQLQGMSGDSAIAAAQLRQTVAGQIQALQQQLARTLLAIRDNYTQQIDALPAHSKAAAAALRDQLAQALLQARDATAQQVQQLRDGLTNGLEQARIDATQQATGLRQGVAGQLLLLQEQGQDRALQLRDGVTVPLQQLQTAGTSALATLTAAGTQSLSDLHDGSLTTSTALSSDTVAQLDTMRGLAEQVFIHFRDDLLTIYSVMHDDAVTFGKSLAQGIIEGIQGQLVAVNNAVTHMSIGAVSAAKNAVGVHSPSTVFHQIGQNIAQGLAQGIADTQHLATQAAATMLGSTAQTPGLAAGSLRPGATAAQPTGPVTITVYVQDGAVRVQGSGAETLTGEIVGNTVAEALDQLWRSQMRITPGAANLLPGAIGP